MGSWDVKYHSRYLFFGVIIYPFLANFNSISKYEFVLKLRAQFLALPTGEFFV